MKKSTSNTHLKTFGSFFAAGLLMFGAASCNPGEEREDSNDMATDKYLEGAEAEEVQTDPVLNPDTEAFSQYDKNTDQKWDREEFTMGVTDSRIFNTWDADQNGFIDENEFNTGITTGQGSSGTISSDNSDQSLFKDWDNDSNGSISQDEFNEGTFARWDLNRDGSLDNDEYTRGMGTGN